MTPLAIVGIGSMFPDAENSQQFWTNIKTGVDSIREVPESHWRADDYFDADPKTSDKVYAKLGGFLSPVSFNPMDYGILPNALEAIDTSQLLGLLAVEQALEDAGYCSGKEYNRDRVSVILGVTGTLELVVPLGARLGHPRWKQALAEAGVDEETAADVMTRLSDSYVPWQENSFPGLLGNVVAGRISKHFNFGGTNCVVDAACGSSLSALNLAALELAAGRSDMVITMSERPAASSRAARFRALNELPQAASTTQLVPPKLKCLLIRPATTLPSSPGKEFSCQGT